MWESNGRRIGCHGGKSEITVAENTMTEQQVLRREWGRAACIGLMQVLTISQKKTRFLSVITL